MEKTLRRASLKKVLPRILVCFLLFIVLLAVTGLGVFKLLAGPTALSQLDAADAQGRYVSVDASQALAAFASYSTDDKVSEEYFILALDDGRFMAISAKGSNIDLLEAAGDQAEDFYVNGTLDTMQSMGSVSGTVSTMADELYEYMDQALESMSNYIPVLQGEDGYSDQILYVCLKVDRVGWLSTKYVVILSVLALLFLLLGIAQIVLVYSGSYQREVTALLKPYLRTEDDRAAVEADFAEAQVIEHVRVGKDFTWYQIGARAMVLRNDQVIWGYCQIEPLVVSKYRWPMCLWMRDGNCLTPHLEDQRSVKAILKALADGGNQFLSGYDANRLRRCEANFDDFLEEVDRELY
jgi:hypothetical protein